MNRKSVAIGSLFVVLCFAGAFVAYFASTGEPPIRVEACCRTRTPTVTRMPSVTKTITRTMTQTVTSTHPPTSTSTLTETPENTPTLTSTPRRQRTPTPTKFWWTPTPYTPTPECPCPCPPECTPYPEGQLEDYPSIYVFHIEDQTCLLHMATGEIECFCTCGCCTDWLCESQ